MKLLKLLFYILWIIFIYCSTSNIRQQSTESEKKYSETASAKFGKQYTSIHNANKNYVICQKLLKSSSKPIILPPLEFFIYDMDKDTIIFTDNLPNGNVKWLDQNEIEVRFRSGTIKRGEIQRNIVGYNYHIKTGKKKIIYDKNILSKDYGKN